MNNVQIVQPDVQDLQVSGGGVMEQAKSLVVCDDASFARGGEILLEIKRISKTVEERFSEPVSLAHKTHKALTSLRDMVMTPFKTSEATIKTKLGTYQMDLERKRQQEAERLRRQAEAQAEAERIATAQQQMDNGDLKACEATLNAPAAPIIVRVETPEAPKLAGVSMRDKWFFEVTNVNQIPLEYMVPDLKAIGGIVTSLGGKTKIPGIRVWAEKVVSGRSAA